MGNEAIRNERIVGASCNICMANTRGLAISGGDRLIKWPKCVVRLTRSSWRLVFRIRRFRMYQILSENFVQLDNGVLFFVNLQQSVSCLLQLVAKSSILLVKNVRRWHHWNRVLRADFRCACFFLCGRDKYLKKFQAGLVRVICVWKKLKFTSLDLLSVK